MLLYIFVIALSTPFPIAIFSAFFSHYPFVPEVSYVLGVKPTRALEQEIDHFGLAKIKWHTPYDYSLKKQTVRYDFLDSKEDGSLWRFKDGLFDGAVNKAFKRPDNHEINDFLSKLDSHQTYYPTLIKTGPNKDLDNYTCAIKIRFKQTPTHMTTLQLNEKLMLTPIKQNKQDIYYDASQIFYPIRTSWPNHTPACIGYYVPKSQALYQFWITRLILPHLYSDTSSIKKIWRRDIDFSLHAFLKALERI